MKPCLLRWFLQVAPDDGRENFMKNSGKFDVIWCKFWFVFELLTFLGCFAASVVEFEVLFCFDHFVWLKSWRKRFWRISEVLAKFIMLHWKQLKRGQWYFRDHSFLRGWNPPLFWGNPPPFWVPPLSEANLKSCPPLSEMHPNWYMQICKKYFKVKVLHFLLYLVNREHH